MRAKRRTEQEQYEIMMECRQSGLSDHQWCLEHDINPVNLSSLRPYEVICRRLVRMPSLKFVN